MKINLQIAYVERVKQGKRSVSVLKNKELA